MYTNSRVRDVFFLQKTHKVKLLQDFRTFR